MLRVIHRDLAARNCLLDKHDNCKISDFGLSLYGKLHKENKMLKVPVRWLAPETLATGMYSSKTDVWSFGVLMFEVFSNGETPYKDIKQLKLVRKMVLREGLRLKPPEDMTSEDAVIMTACFETEPQNRMSFKELKAKYKETTNTGLIPRLTQWIQNRNSIEDSAPVGS
ncbi:unnamed protein product [Caenorhabditis auriculariae]|uniref:Protein kinase domain-containing protein n=1 Tax=Caenorhabditis auriculariae TaxID=2777116 RepID=A0A8S1HSX1_9PELO|nr:unnamed protein product [Caenorhabditis auriculariae]